jgi:glycosyltransferase involved in cell wall biosynthesis
MGASGLRRRVGRVLERVFVPQCAAIVVVNNSIGEWYRQRHPRARVVVVRNVPPRTFVPGAPSTRLRDLCGIPADHLVFLYQGTIGEGRAVGLVLDAFGRAAPDRHIVFLGYGELEDDVRRVAASHSNVHFLPGVAPSDLLEYTSSADVGLCLIENRCLSYYLSLPNKLFEYIVAGVPVIVSAFPEMAAIVDSTGSGWAIPVQADELERLVGSLDRSEVERRAVAARAAGGSLAWETEALPLIDLYRDVVRS